MKLSVFLAATLVAFASIASAAPLCTSLNVVTLADYVALGSTGCQIGDKVFFNFFDSPTSGGSATAPVPASAVSVTPVGAGTYNPGLTFSSSDWSVTGGSTTANSFLDMSFGFTVSVLPGGNSIDDASVTMGTPVPVDPWGNHFGGERFHGVGYPERGFEWVACGRDFLCAYQHDSG
jgi:hypothetical protein